MPIAYLLADTDLLSSNPLFEVLEDWNAQLSHINFTELYLDNEETQS